MKITEIQEDIFQNLTPGDVIAHGANCQGIMGAGVALPIKMNFPGNFDAYRFACITGKFRPGDSLGYVENGILVFNLATQFELGPDAHVVNVEKSVKDMIRKIEAQPNHNITKIKTVRLGSGIGGLDWKDVRKALAGIRSDIGLEVYYI